MLLQSVEDLQRQLLSAQQPQEPINNQQQRSRRGYRQASVALPNDTISTNPLVTCCQNAWESLSKYYTITDKNQEIYAAATLLNPSLRRRYFDLSWTGATAAAIPTMIQYNRGIWERNYTQNQPIQLSETRGSQYSLYMARFQPSETTPQQSDDFERYLAAPQTPEAAWKDQGLFIWWNTSDCPGLRQWAFDTLSIPAMSAELERVFSQARRTITDDRNRLLPESVEAVQCLKQWHNQGVYDISHGTEQLPTSQSDAWLAASLAE